jgi:hypothetical protein
MNDSSGTHFGFYEIIRILVPGFYFSVLFLFLGYFFLSRFFTIPIYGDIIAVMLVFLTIVSGLTMYSKETPKRRKAFAENQPSTYLQELSRRIPSIQMLSDTDAKNLYFYILNHFIPPVFHEKIFYFGTVYNVMIQIRRTSFWFAVISAIIIAFDVSKGEELSELAGMLIFTSVVLLIYFLNVIYDKADRKMQENYRDQIFWLQMNEEIVDELFRKYTRIKKSGLK